MEYKGGHPFYGDAIGILMLDMGAPLVPGNVGNAYSYNFPVRFKVLKGVPSDWWCDDIGPDDSRCRIFIDAAKELEAEGCKAITSGCGFFAIYQQRTVAEVNIPVFTSPLLMVPMLSRMIGPDKKVGIITAGGSHLSSGTFLKSVGIDASTPFVIGGMEHSPEFYNVHVTQNKNTINVQRMEEEVLQVAKDLLRKNPDIGVFLFECSDLPPYAQRVARETGLPVFDFISLAHLVYRAIAPVKYPDFIG
ncbi:aspartate/glutamate racemase family protein [Caproiciproducens sp.]